MTGDAINPDEYDPDVQSGVEYSRPKDLQAAGIDHPLFRRALQTGVLSEEEIEQGKTIPWNVPATVLKHMSDGLYLSEEATVREFESNGETATLKVERSTMDEYSGAEIDSIQIVEDDYQPVVEVYNRKDKNRIIFRDNGKGIESATVLNVVRKIGATTARDTGSLTGSFGMGLASFLKLIGLDNSMIMRTRSRITDESFAAYVNLGGFDPIVGGLDEGDYGTEFEMVHNGDLDADLREAVEKYSEWMRVPVHYEEYDNNGKLVFDEDWGGKSFLDTYPDDSYCVVYEIPGLVTAACSAEAEGTTLLNSMVTERNDGASSGTKKFGCAYPFDVRIEDESGAIVAVPDGDGYDTDHELVGRTPVSDAEFNIMSATQRENYVQESQVPNDVVTLPVPTSSRDSLQQNDDFWKFLAHMIQEKFEADCTEIYGRFDGPGDILNLQGRELSIALKGVNETDYGHGKSLQQAVYERFGVSLSASVVSALEVMDMTLAVAEPGNNVDNISTDDDGMKVYEIVLQSERDNGDVYMGCTLNQKKSKIAWDLGREDYTKDETPNMVVEIPGKSWYERFQKAFGWKKLQDISLRNISQYQSDMSELQYNKLLTEMGLEDFDNDREAMAEAKRRAKPTPPEQERLNVSVSQKTTEQSKFNAKNIKKHFEDGQKLAIEKKTSGYSRTTKTYDVDKIILAPSSSERNISDYYWLGGEYGGGAVALANCNVSTYEYLSSVEGIFHIDKFAEMAWRMPIETSDGVTNIRDSKDNLVIHTVHDSNKDRFMDIVDEVPETLRNFYESGAVSHFNSKVWKGPDFDEMVYAPVTMDELFEILPALKESDVTIVYGDMKPNNSFQTTELTYLKNDVWVYAATRLNNWDLSSVEMSNILSRGFSDLSKGGYELVETMAFRHDKGIPPVSQV